MRCISPILIRANGRRDFVPCGKCNFCLEVKRAEWSFRLNQEYRIAKSAKFLTLTYDDDHAPLNADSMLPQLYLRDVQLFTKRLRKLQASESTDRLRYYTVGEYGDRTMRPHYHSIMFNMTNSVTSELPNIWKLGHIYVGTVTPQSIHYVTKYVINRHNDYTGREPPFSIMSTRPGLGSNYLDTHKQYHLANKRNFTKTNGQIARLPRYYKDKIFTAQDKAILAIGSIEHADHLYDEEITRLARLHHDPEGHYEERVIDAHNSITSKINEFNKF